MNKKICVYTCITGNYDSLHEISSPEKNVDYLCFTNNKNLKSKTWKIVQIDNGGLEDQRLSRKIKMLGHPIISKKYDVSVWMDASVVWKKNISEFIKVFLKDSSFAAFKHHQRTTVLDEAIACLRCRKDTKENIVNTLAFLKSEGFPDNLGLFEMTVFIKKHNDPKVIETMRLWNEINSKYSKRDQLEFMYAIWKTKLNISPINLNVWENVWFYTLTHTKVSKINECHIYFGDPDNNFSFDKSFSYNYNFKDNIYSLSCNIPFDVNQITISLSEAIGTLFSNIKISPSSSKVIPSTNIQYGEGITFHSAENLITIKNTFKKGQHLSLSFNARPLNNSELCQIIQQIKYQNMLQQESITQLQSEYSHILREKKASNLALNATKKELESIVNSKSWRTICKIRKLLPPY